MTVKIIVDFARSPRVTLEYQTAIGVLDCILDRHGGTRDLVEAKRMISSFDDYYEFARRKFHDYLSPPKDPSDSIAGRVVIQKIRLTRNNDSRIVELVFDRRFLVELITECVSEVTGEEVVIEKQSF